jgi:hypothetical protein
MHGVFSQQLGGLKRQESNMQQQLEDVGFIATFVRECPAARASFLDTASEKPFVAGHQQHDYTSENGLGDAPSSNGSISETTRSHKRRTTQVKMPFGKDGGSKKISRNNSKDSNRWYQAARKVSKSLSDASSNKSKHRRSRNNSSSAEPKPESGRTSGIFCLKGLPPSEAMLSRREIRACSVVDDDTAALRNQLNTVISEEPSLAGTGKAGSRNCSPQAQTTMVRKVKPVQDATTVVQGVIARLDNLANEGLGGSSTAEIVDVSKDKQPSELRLHRADLELSAYDGRILTDSTRFSPGDDLELELQSCASSRQIS